MSAELPLSMGIPESPESCADHAGKTGVIAYQALDAYGGRLGFFCKQHPDANLIEASEQILTDLDRSI